MFVCDYPSVVWFVSEGCGVERVAHVALWDMQGTEENQQLEYIARVLLPSPNLLYIYTYTLWIKNVNSAVQLYFIYLNIKACVVGQTFSKHPSQF